MRAGLVGLGVMGRNLALNLAEKGHDIVVTDPWESARAWSAPGITSVAGYAALAANLGAGNLGASNVGAGNVGAGNVGIASGGGGRVILLMVKAGAPVDQAIAELLPHLAVGDILIDGGNSNYKDTERRGRELADREVGFLGCGISGGAEGARHGAAIMVGGAEADWLRAQSLLTSFAAAAGADGRPTVDYFGSGGAGHFVKMVHNGIEYAIMQAIAEAHALLRDVGGLDAVAISDQFAQWAVESWGAGFLIEITAEIAKARDDLTGELLLPLVDDVAGQKGTGGWTVEAALAAGVAAPAIMEAVAARQVSGARDPRRVMQQAAASGLARGLAGGVASGLASGLASGTARGGAGLSPRAASPAQLVADVEAALVGTMLGSLAQGVAIYAETAREKGWPGAVPAVLRVWRAGSILRMRMLDDIADALEVHGGGPARSQSGGPDGGAHLLAVPALAAKAAGLMPGWRRAGIQALANGVPAPAITSTLAYLDALATSQLPTAMVQAQRDRFGAHGFRRRDREGDFQGPWVQPDAAAF